MLGQLVCLYLISGIKLFDVHKRIPLVQFLELLQVRRRIDLDGLDGRRICSCGLTLGHRGMTRGLAPERKPHGERLPVTLLDVWEQVW